MSQNEPIVFNSLIMYSSELVGERKPVRANTSSSFLSKNASGNLKNIEKLEDVRLLGKNTSLKLKEVID